MQWLAPRDLVETHLWHDAVPNVWAGIDEAGRGPLAGPVVAACVVLPPEPLPSCLKFLNDSKKLSEDIRPKLAEAIREVALGWGVGIVSHQEIDRINILQATFKAMRIAYDQMELDIDCAFVDGNQLPQLPCKMHSIVKGDSKVAAIAAASVLAKVQRDQLMLEADEVYPEYGFRWHKGYGTAMHREALRLFGASPIHRQSFITRIEQLMISDEERVALSERLHRLRSAQSFKQGGITSMEGLETSHPLGVKFLEQYLRCIVKEMSG